MSPTRYSEPEEDAPDDTVHVCNRGWIGSPDADHPVPCLICRPHLARRITGVGD